MLGAISPRLAGDAPSTELCDRPTVVIISLSRRAPAATAGPGLINVSRSQEGRARSAAPRLTLSADTC